MDFLYSFSWPFSCYWQEFLGRYMAKVRRREHQSDHKANKARFAKCEKLEKQ